jgi:hypothetical protein
MYSSLLPCYLIPLGPKYPPQHFILENQCLQHSFYNLIFKIKYKLQIFSGSAPTVQQKIVGAHLPPIAIYEYTEISRLFVVSLFVYVCLLALPVTMLSVSQTV